MSILKCKMCGGTLEIDNKTVATINATINPNKIPNTISAIVVFPEAHTQSV